MCHCRNCQKSSGAGHILVAVFPRDSVVIKGKTKTYANTADSGATATAMFCPTCGSQMFGSSTNFESLLAIRVQTMVGRTFFHPQAASYIHRQRAWDHGHPGIPSFAGMPPASAKD
jgi:hypothetical protein